MSMRVKAGHEDCNTCDNKRYFKGAAAHGACDMPCSDCMEFTWYTIFEFLILIAIFVGVVWLSSLLANIT